MYENGQDTVITYMTAVLTGGITDLLNQVEYAVNINSYDRNMLENYKNAKADLERQQAELEDEQEALALLKDEVEKKKEQVASQQKAAGSKISSYEDMIAQLENELGSVEELIQEKTKLLNELIAKAEKEEEQARIAAAQQAASSMGTNGIIVGDAGISHGNLGLSDYEIMLLAAIIYCEAGNQGLDGQLAVGYVVMNRVRSKLYPGSVEAVIRQSKQFEPVGSGRFDLVLKAEQDPDIPNIVTQSCWTAARTVINGSSNVGDSLFFRTWAPVPQLITNLENGNVPYWIIKDHIFYYYWTPYSQSTPSTEPDEDEDDDEDDERDEPTEPEEPDTPDDPEPDTTDDPQSPSGDDAEDDPQSPSEPENTDDPQTSASEPQSTGTTPEDGQPVEGMNE